MVHRVGVVEEVAAVVMAEEVAEVVVEEEGGEVVVLGEVLLHLERYLWKTGNAEDRVYGMSDHLNSRVWVLSLQR